MSRGLFIGCVWLGLVPTLVIFFFLGHKRRAWIPPLGWWLSISVGTVMLFYGMSHATSPSFTNRVTAVGKIHDFVERGRRDSYFAFRLVPEVGPGIDMETHISFPHWGNPSILAQRTFRVVYLLDGDLSLKNEAVDIQILSGPDAGFHESLDSRPVGKWLFIPAGAVFLTFGMFGLRYMKEDAEAAINDDDES